MNVEETVSETSFSKDDVRWMKFALRLAERGYTPPNPRVGCVIVKDGALVGEGFHPYAGAPHAEVFALQAAGERARGATAYVTLEPCAHHGRTPPCVLALIDSGVSRVVAAVQDPNPKVAGGGFAILRKAGVQVQVGLLEQQAHEVDAPFFFYQQTGRPYVSLKAAMTLDGKIATSTGDSKWITGEKARALVHRIRAQYSAILCGVGTVLADDPLLTARFKGAPRQPTRIILDRRLRTPPSAKVVQTASEIPTIIVAGHDHDSDQAKIMQSCGVEILSVTTDINGQIPLSELLAEMGRREMVSILVEGGGRTHATFLQQKQVQHLYWFVAPRLAGGRDAPSPIEGDGVERMADAVQLENVKTRKIGNDLLIEANPVFQPLSA
jgi:diaminohydroxyphosphoribosylaminopyrimidine deaminase/5-amino-6-(5-phosphoribosylamino)uracil reductase